MVVVCKTCSDKRGFTPMIKITLHFAHQIGTVPDRKSDGPGYFLFPRPHTREHYGKP